MQRTLAAQIKIKTCVTRLGLIVFHACSGAHKTGVPDASSGKLRDIVVEADKVSVKRLLSAPTCPVERSSYCEKRFSMVHPCSIFRTHWMGIIQRLHMDKSQIDAMLAGRTMALEKLKVVYEVCFIPYAAPLWGACSPVRVVQCFPQSLNYI